MDPSAKEAAMKKKLQQFLLEMFRMGTVRGFQHFSMYLRGKEEMGLTVYHEPQIASRRCSILHSVAPEMLVGESLTSSHLPYDQQALVLSQGTQMRLSGMEDRGVGLPPASPSDNELSSDPASNQTLFLIAGYTRYSCPYTWVRSNHKRLMKLSRVSDEGKDSPLRLKSTTRWKDQDVHVWEIIAELVKLCMYPAPRNPFSVDMDYFLSLSTQQQLLSTAAMMVCLQKIVLHTPDDRPYAGKVLEDLHIVSRLHYDVLHNLIISNQLPVHEFHKQQKTQPQTRQTHHSGGSAKRSSFSHSREKHPSTESTGSQSHYSQLSGERSNYSQPSGDEYGGGMSVQSTHGVYTSQGSASTGFPGYGFTPAPSLF